MRRLSNSAITEYWSLQESNPMTKLLQNVLGSLPSDAAVERLFSVAGDIQRPKRAKLSPENLSRLLLIV